MIVWPFSIAVISFILRIIFNDVPDQDLMIDLSEEIVEFKGTFLMLIIEASAPLSSNPMVTAPL